MRSTKISWNTFATVTHLILVSIFVASARGADDQKAARERTVKSWQEMFGKDIDFSEVELYVCMAYVYPQPDKAFQEIADKKLGVGLMAVSIYWMNTFFKPACRPNVTKVPPEKYYLPKSGETGLLLHEWRSPKYRFKAQECGNGVLVRILPKGFNPKRPLSDTEVAGLLMDVFDLKYASIAGAVAGFKLPKVLSRGKTFTNAVPLRIWVGPDWRDSIVGFIGDDGVYVICYKSNTGGMRVGFPIDRTWLNRGLLEKDGKTLVAPPPEEKDGKP